MAIDMTSNNQSNNQTNNQSPNQSSNQLHNQYHPSYKVKFDVDKDGNILWISAHRTVSNQVDMANRLIDKLITQANNQSNNQPLILSLHGLGDAIAPCIEIAHMLLQGGKLTTHSVQTHSVLTVRGSPKADIVVDLLINRSNNQLNNHTDDEQAYIQMTEGQQHKHDDD